MSGYYYDGDFETASQEGPVIPDVDLINRARSWRQTMVQAASFWEPFPLGSAGPAGGILINETTPQLVHSHIVKWERIFSEVPQSHQIASSMAYSYQFTLNGDLAEIPIGTSCLIQCDYFNTTKPETIDLIRASRYVKVGDVLFYLGSKPIDAPLLAASDSELERWNGDIWLRKTPYVSSRVLKQLLGV